VLVGLVALALLTFVADASAQRRGGGGGGRGGYGGGYGGGRSSISIGIGGYGYGNGYYGGRYYGSGYGSGYGGRYYGGGYYNNGWSYPSYYYSSPSYYSEPSYYSDSVVQVPSESRPSYYADPSAANVTVFVPDANAEVWFDNAQTSQRGMERIYQTPGLQSAGTYTIRARWMSGNRPIDQTRQVRVQPGQSVTVDFRSENLPVPRP